MKIFLVWLIGACYIGGCLGFATFSTLLASPAIDSQHNNNNHVPTYRAVEISQVLFGRFLRPVVSNLIENGVPSDWNSFWSQTASGSKTTNAQRLAAAVEQLGPTYVKFAQAVSSRPDVVPKSLADALSILQDDMEPFDSDTAKQIIRYELLSNSTSLRLRQPDKLEEFLQSLSAEPVAAASVGQVFKGQFPGYGEVAVKVQRPGIRTIVERDAQLLRSVASWLESIPAIQLPSNAAAQEHSLQSTSSSLSNAKTNRLINTELVSSVDEFMSRLFEELDYHKEAANMEKFASLYSVRRGSSKNVKVVVPEVLLDLCTDNVIVMEWIDGNKLTNVVNEGDVGSNKASEDVIAENLQLVQLCIDCTLSQLLDTGVLHADPHGGNLLKVKRQTSFGKNDPYATKTKQRRRSLRRLVRSLRRKWGDSSNEELPQLGYLDFGMLSTVDSQVQDALVCAVVHLVFARDVENVAKLFGELQLLPAEVVNSPQEMAALEHALDQMFDDILIWDNNNSSSAASTQIPTLRFDKLLDSLTRLVPRFQFDLPPYFLNNARALSTLEGIARSLDPTFSVLQVVYPYALNRLLRNPLDSRVVDDTLQSLIRSPETGRIVRSKVGKMLDDAALITGFKRRKVLLDILKTRGGLRLTRMIAQEGLMDTLLPKHLNRRRKF